MNLKKMNVTQLKKMLNTVRRKRFDWNALEEGLDEKESQIKEAMIGKGHALSKKQRKLVRQMNKKAGKKLSLKEAQVLKKKK